MRNLKKFLALVLALVMAFSLMVTANAANSKTDYPDMDSVLPEFEEAVDVLSGMGVFRGNNGQFLPQNSIMRCEAVAILYRLTTGDVDDKQVELYAPLATHFNDVKATDWFAPYVGFAVDAGYIKGYNGNFNPYANVTGYEMLAMLLRAVGYGKNGEFTGAQWRINVGAQAESLNVLKDVKSTHYANTLSQASPREVVANLTFRVAAYVPTVRYEYGYYNQYQGVAMAPSGTNNIKNDTLGYREFGLTLKEGVVVGNQATGENVTKVGGGWPSQPGSQNVLDQYGNKIIVEYGEAAHTTVVKVITKFKSADGTLDADYGTAIADMEANPTTTVYAYLTTTVPGYGAYTQYNYNVSDWFNFKTGLDLFGHKVHAWYDNRTSAARYTTYAIIDKAELVKTVFADNALLNANSATSTINLLDAAQDAGFTGANKDWTAAFMSDRYSQFSAARDNDDSIKSKVGMYTLISNDSSLDVDVVIVLNQEVARIDQRNSTAKDGEYIFLGTGHSTFGSQLSTGTAGKLFDSQLSPDSVKTLGTVVTAHQIVGTNSSANVDGAGAVSRDYATAKANVTVTAPKCWYQTDKLEPAFTGTIATYKVGTTDIDTKWIAQNAASAPEHIVTEVTLTDGKSYKLSGITGSQFEYGFDTTPDSHLINGVDALTDYNTAAGVTFSFFADAVGRFIGVGIPNDYKFLYTTFADYEVGALGTGTLDYYTYGVDWNGNIVKANNQVTSIRMPVDSDSTPSKLDEAQADTLKWPSNGHVLAEGYNTLPVTLKDQGQAKIGNQIRSGINTRFMLSPDGTLDWYSANEHGHNYNQYGTRFTTWFDGSDSVNTWTINSTDAKNGFARVYNDKDEDATTALVTANAAGDSLDYLLTNDTKFIVVTGSGTADLSVKIYNGLTELLDGGTSAIISSGIKMNADGDTVDGYGDNVYFLTAADQFGNTDVEKNRTITTVIMADTNLTQYKTQSLYFSAPGNVATTAKLAGYDNTTGIYGTVNQYKLYNNGVEGYYWVADDLSTGADGVVGSGTDDANGTADKGDFYRLTPVGTVNNQPIYMATCATQTSVTDTRMSNDVDVRYDYIVVNNLSTADINGQVFKVDGAVVCEAYGENVKGGTGTKQATFVETNTIDSVEKLHHAVSMGKAGESGNLYYVYVAIVNDGINVSTIYVTDVNTLAH